MNLEKVKEVAADQVFMESLFQMETPAEVQEALQEKDIVVTEEELNAIRALLIKIDNGEISQEQMEQLQKQAEDGEMSEELLEQVSGGLIFSGVSGIIALTAMIVGAASAGTGAGVGVFLGVKHAIKNKW